MSRAMSVPRKLTPIEQDDLEHGGGVLVCDRAAARLAYVEQRLDEAEMFLGSAMTMLSERNCPETSALIRAFLAEVTHK